MCAKTHWPEYDVGLVYLAYMPILRDLVMRWSVAWPIAFSEIPKTNLMS